MRRSFAIASVSPITLSASGSYGGGAVRLSQFNCRKRAGSEIFGIGHDPAVGLRVVGRRQWRRAAGLAERYLAARGTRLSGTLRIDATIGGSLSSPSADGLFSISNASVNDPLSNLRLNQIGVVAGLRGDTAVDQPHDRPTSRRRLGQRFSGTIGLSGQLPANPPSGFPMPPIPTGKPSGPRFPAISPFPAD
jgi:translocation and assembly module TamB